MCDRVGRNWNERCHWSLVIGQSSFAIGHWYKRIDQPMTNDKRHPSMEGRMTQITCNGRHTDVRGPHHSAFENYKPYDLNGLKTYDLSSRPSKVFHDDLGRPAEPGTSVDA